MALANGVISLLGGFFLEAARVVHLVYLCLPCFTHRCLGYLGRGGCFAALSCGCWCGRSRRMLCRVSDGQVDSLAPLLDLGGCFAVVVLCLGGCFAVNLSTLRLRMLGRRGRAIRWMLGHRFCASDFLPWYLW